MVNYYRYWGKSEKDGMRYHLLPFHCLDVAAVGWLLLDPDKPLCKRLSAQLHIAPELLQSRLTFFLSLHDTGKFATAFQGIVPNLSPNLVQKNPRMDYSVRHDTLGYMLWRESLKGALEEAQTFGKLSDSIQLGRALDIWMQIVTGHHGIPPQYISNFYFLSHFTPQDKEAALQFTLSVHSLFLQDNDAAILAGKPYRRTDASTEVSGP